MRLNLRIKIFLWLLPVLIPVICIISLSYISGRDTSIKNSLSFTSLILEDVSNEFNTFLSKTFINSIGLMETIDFETYTRLHRKIVYWLESNSVFSMQVLADINGKVIYNHNSSKKNITAILPRNILGNIIIDDQIQRIIQSNYQSWKNNIPKWQRQIVINKNKIKEFESQGRKNFSGYSEIQTDIYSLKNKLHLPPSMIFFANDSILKKAGLPYSFNYFYVIPTESYNGKQNGYLISFLDFEVFKKNLNRLENKLKSYGFPNARTALININNAQTLLLSGDRHYEKNDNIASDMIFQINSNLGKGKSKKIDSIKSNK